MDIISDLKNIDSVRFTVRRVDCITSDLSPFAFFKLVKWDSIVTLSYTNDSKATKKIILTPFQIKQVIKLEKQIDHVGSTTYDEYRVTRDNHVVLRGRDINYSKILTGFFQD